MLYRLIKHILRIYFPLFFNKIHIEGLDMVPNDKPVLFAVNHQNTMIDATLVAYQLKKNTYFLVRSDVFKGRLITWIFKVLHLIPISRGNDGLNSMAGFNKKIFSQCIEHFNHKKMILIFPEGKSKAHYRLSKFKKGVARLALQAEAKHKFNLNLHVVPVTINYENHFEGNSDVWIKYCEPIIIKNYQESYQENKARTIKQLLEKIEKSIKENMILFEDHEYAKSFFEMVVEQSVSSTTSLLKHHQNLPVKKLKERKKKINKLYTFLSIASKLSFFPAILLTLLLNRIVRDIDFKLSIISFSLLVFSTIQLVVVGIFSTIFYGWLSGLLISSFSIIVFITLIKTYFFKD